MNTLAVLVGVLVSLVIQPLKREKASTLENVLLVAGANVGAAAVSSQLGAGSLDAVQMAISSYAWYGLTGQSKVMQTLAVAWPDKAVRVLGEAVKSLSSNP